MIYPAYVHKDSDSAYGVTLPDFPGCFSAADDYHALPQRVQEALELYFEGEGLPLPAPSDLAALQSDKQYEGGVWMLIDIDTAKLDSKPKRLNVSLPESLVARMDEYRSQHKLTRSALIARGVEAYLGR